MQVSIPSARGPIANRSGADPREAARAGFQSPPHGDPSRTTLNFQITSPGNKFQSPPHGDPSRTFALIKLELDPHVMFQSPPHGDPSRTSSRPATTRTGSRCFNPLRTGTHREPGGARGGGMGGGRRFNPLRTGTHREPSSVSLATRRSPPRFNPLRTGTHREPAETMTLTDQQTFQSPPHGDPSRTPGNVRRFTSTLSFNPLRTGTHREPPAPNHHRPRPRIQAEKTNLPAPSQEGSVPSAPTIPRPPRLSKIRGPLLRAATPVQSRRLNAGF